jgi:uncharacterized membrane protein YuzA (DUF378 family)
MYRWNIFDVLMSTLLIIGGLNWGSIALFDFNFVSALFGADTPAANAIYLLVGLAALYVFFVGFTRASVSNRRVAY